MKYLFVSLDGLIGDIAWEVVKEGHDVKFYINDAAEKEIADGFVPKTDNWEAEVDGRISSCSTTGWDRERTRSGCERPASSSLAARRTPIAWKFHIEDVKTVNGEWLVTGTSGVVLIVCGIGSTMKQAQRQAYKRVRNVMIPNMYYREDIGDRWFEEDSDRLHAWGYLRE